jgi:hypothetical protein
VLFIPSCPGYTSLTGASHRSDRCNPCWVFSRVNVWVCLLLSCVADVSSFGWFGARLACLVFWGFLVVTGRTGVLHRPGRCGATLWKSPSFTSSDRSDRCWSVDSRLVFRCVLGSEGCVLVPRSSGTAVATWTWPTWVVSRRRVLEAVFILLESRRIFIGSHSLPPLSGSPYRSFNSLHH